MSAGKRNRLVTIQRRVTSATDTGSRNVSWETFAQVYAEKRDSKTGASENTMSSTQYPILRVEWVIRFLPGITPSMRVVYEGETWEIINIADDSFRRDYKVLLCELRGNGSTSGGLTCQPATYQNAAEDATFTQTIQSGAVFTAEPITVTEVDGSTRTELANEDVTCAFIEIEVFDTNGTLIETVTEYPDDGRITVPAASGSGTYSNGGSFEVEIDAGDTYTAPAIEVTDVDGSTRASLPNIGVVCEWATLQVESSDGQQAVKDVTEYPAGGVVVVGDQSILDAEDNSFTLPYRSSTIVNNALISTAVNDTPLDGYHNLTIEVNVPVVNSAGDSLGGNVTDLLTPHDLPDVTLDDDNATVGEYPMPSVIIIDGEVDSAAYTTVSGVGTLTITPAGGGITPSGISYVHLTPATSLIDAGASGLDVVALWQAGSYTITNPANPAVQACLDPTDAARTTLLNDNFFGNKYRYTDTAGNPSSVGTTVPERIDWLNHDWSGAVQYIVIDHLHKTMLWVRYIDNGGKIDVSNTATGDTWYNWLTHIAGVTLGGYTGWLPIMLNTQLPHAAACDAGDTDYKSFFIGHASGNRLQILTGESYTSARFYPFIDSLNAALIGSAGASDASLKAGQAGFRADITAIFAMRIMTDAEIAALTP